MNETATPQDQNLFSGKKPSISELSNKLVSFDDAPVETADGVPTSKYLTQIVQKYGSGAQQQPAGTPAAAPTAQPAAAIPATQPEAPITQPDTPAAAPAAPVAQPAAPATNDTYKAVSSIQDPDIQARLEMVKKNSSPEEFQRYIDEMGKHDPKKIVDQLNNLPVEGNMDFLDIKKDLTKNLNTYQKIISNSDDTDLQARLDVVKRDSTPEEFQRYIDAMNSTSPEAVIKQLKGIDMNNNLKYISSKNSRDADNSLPGQALHLAGGLIGGLANAVGYSAREEKRKLGLRPDAFTIPTLDQNKEDEFLPTVGKTVGNMGIGLLNATVVPGGNQAQLINALNPEQVKDIATGSEYLKGNQNLTKTAIGQAALLASGPKGTFSKLGGITKGIDAAVKAIDLPIGVKSFVNKITTKNAAAIDTLNADPYKAPIVNAVQQTVASKVGNLASTTSEDFVNTAKMNATKELGDVYGKVRGDAYKATINPEKFTDSVFKDALENSDLNMNRGKLSLKKGGSVSKGGIQEDMLPQVKEAMDKVRKQLTDGHPNALEMVNKYLTMKNNSVFPKTPEGLPVAKNLEANFYKAIEAEFKKNGIDIAAADKQYAKSMENVATLAKSTHRALKAADQSTLQNMIGSVQKIINPKEFAGELSTDQVRAAGIDVKQNPTFGSALNEMLGTQARSGTLGNAAIGQQNDQTQQSGQGSTQQPGKKMSRAEAQAYMKSLGL